MSRIVAVCIAEIFIGQVHLVIVTHVSMGALADLQIHMDTITAHVKKVSGENYELVFITICHLSC
jgi:hypothetical protein